jgi:hypothetical protein
MMVALTGYQIGIVAVGVAFLVATGVRVGSRGAGRTGMRAVSVGLTLLAMAAAEFLSVRHFVNEQLAAEGFIERIPVLVSPVAAVTAVGQSLAMDPMTLAFWAIALFAAWRYSATSPG